jgi:hypothetical protein
MLSGSYRNFPPLNIVPLSYSFGFDQEVFHLAKGQVLAGTLETPRIPGVVNQTLQ